MHHFSFFRAIALFLLLFSVQLICQEPGEAEGRNQKDAENRSSAVPIAITWDDNYVDEWYNLKDTLRYYDVKCTFFVCSFTNLTKRQVEKLKVLESEGHEIGCHSKSHSDAELFVNKYGIEKYIHDEIRPEIDAMVKSGLHPISFSYPFGGRSAKLDLELQNYFTTIRGLTSFSKPNFKRPPVVNGIGMDDNFCPVETVISELKKEYSKGQFVVLVGHTPTAKPFVVPRYYTTIDRLVKIIKEAKELGFRFSTISNLPAILSASEVLTSQVKDN
ncbi:MAG: polysaccharide deacetylase family protein [Bacillota bacterium]